MVKNHLSIVFVSLSGLLILASFNVGEAIAMFFIAGMIPGTSYSLDARIMLDIFLLIGGFTLSRLINGAIFSISSRRTLRGVRTA